MLSVLHAIGHTEFDESGFAIVTFHDGTDVEFSADGLVSDESFTGCAFHIREWSDPLVKFMFDVAKAGDMVIFPAMDGPVVGLVTEAQQHKLPTQMRDDFKLACLQSAHELGLMLKRGFEAWADYRDAVRRNADP